MDHQTILILAILLPLAAGSVGLWIWLGKRYECRIRQWCDQNGYTLVELKHPRFMGGLLGPWARKPWPGDWHITVQDEQGGLRSGWVYFGHRWIDLPWGRMHIRWE